MAGCRPLAGPRRRPGTWSRVAEHLGGGLEEPDPGVVAPPVRLVRELLGACTGTPARRSTSLDGASVRRARARSGAGQGRGRAGGLPGLDRRPDLGHRAAPAPGYAGSPRPGSAVRRTARRQSTSLRGAREQRSAERGANLSSAAPFEGTPRPGDEVGTHSDSMTAWQPVADRARNGTARLTRVRKDSDTVSNQAGKHATPASREAGVAVRRAARCGGAAGQRRAKEPPLARVRSSSRIAGVVARARARSIARRLRAA